jgi:hypothetical protein
MPSPAAGGTAVVLVVVHRLVAAGGLGAHLRLEPAALIVGVVELREPVGELLAAHEQLEAVTERRVAVVRARERRHRERELGQERGLHELGFGGGFEQEVAEVSGADAPLALGIPLDQPSRHRGSLRGVGEPRDRVGCGLVADRALDAGEQRAHDLGGRHAVRDRDLGRERRVVEHRARVRDAAKLAHRVADRKPPPRRGELDRLTVPRHRGRADDVARELAEQLLGRVHEVGVGRVGLVELEHRELGVVLP